VKIKNNQFHLLPHHSTVRVTLVSLAVLLFSHSAQAQFNKTAAGPWDYNDTANWTSGVINGNFTAAPAVTLVTVTFAADAVLSTGLNFNFSANNAQRTYALIGSGTDRTITLAGNLTSAGSAGQRTVTIGSTTSGQKLNIDLGGVTRTFLGGSSGYPGVRGLDLLNTVSNGGIATDSTVSGPNQLTLAGNNTYAGGTTLTKGYILNINNGGNSSSNSAIGTGTLTITSSGAGPSAIIDNTSGSAVTLQTNNAQAWDGDFVFADITTRTLAVTHSDLNLGTGAVTLGGATGSRSVTVNSNTLTVGGTISGGRGLSKAGAGTLVLNNTASTYTGISQVSAGILEVSKLADAGLNSSLGAPVASGGNTVLSGTGTLRYVGSGDSTNRALTLSSTPTLDASGSGALLLTSGSNAFGASNSAVTFTLAGTSTANNTYNGNLGNNGSGVIALNKTGTGKWVLSGNTTYSGATTISGGTLQLGAGGTTGKLASTGTIVNNGNLTIDRSNAATQGTDFSAAAITGTGSFTQAGAGTTILNAANTYSGNTTVSGGTLSFGTASLSDTGTVEVASAAFLDLAHGVTDTVDSFKIDGVTQVAGIWGATTSDAPNKTDRITGSGKLSVTNGAGPGSPFATWIATFASITDPAEKTKEADPDKDGLNNLAEFALNGNPADGSANGLTASLLQDTTAPAGKELTYIVATRDGAVFSSGAGGVQSATVSADAVSYKVEGSLDLVFPGSAVSQVSVSNTAPAATGLPDLTGTAWEYHTFRLDASEGLGGKGFLRVVIQQAP
jgi:autotransporter-associated beta strand protein